MRYAIYKIIFCKNIIQDISVKNKSFHYYLCRQPKAGESLVINPKGDVIVKADAKEQLLMCDVNLDESCKL